MKYRKDVYRVTFEVKAKVTMDIYADDSLDAENIAWDKYENLSEAVFLSEAEIKDCVITDVEEIYED